MREQACAVPLACKPFATVPHQRPGNQRLAQSVRSGQQQAARRGIPGSQSQSKAPPALAVKHYGAQHLEAVSPQQHRRRTAAEQRRGSMQRAGAATALLLGLLCLAAAARAESGDLGGLRPPGFRPPSVFSSEWAGAGSGRRSRPAALACRGRPDATGCTFTT